MSSRFLKGGCSCGRNHYTIVIPSQSSEAAKVIFDNSHSHRRSQATPLSAWLRIPLTWYQSTTHSFMSDEDHNSIRRAYTSPNDTSSKRNFCGFCGTPLSYWSESPPSEAEYISLTLGSLSGPDLRDLEDLGLLPKEAVEDAEHDKEKMESVLIEGHDEKEGIDWFETMTEGSRLGRVRKSWGGGKSGDGRYKVEWEIVEWTEGDEKEVSPAKRKIGEVEDNEDGEDGDAMEH